VDAPQKDTQFHSSSGGVLNIASAHGSSIAGGFRNTASANESAIAGGCSNVAGATAPTITECTENEGYFPSILGGVGNQASGTNATVSGGTGHTASTVDGVAGALSSLSIVRTEKEVGAGNSAQTYANCPTGEIATGGGVGAAQGGNSADNLWQTGPVNAANGLFSNTTMGTLPVSWYGSYLNNSGKSETAYTWALCSP
jgi:hypothetical protein